MGLLDEQNVLAGLLGLSDNLRTYGKGLQNRLVGLLTDPAGTVTNALQQQMAPITKQADWRRTGIDAVTGSDDTRSSLARAATDAAMNMAGPTAVGKVVYHGSPHKFDRFDMSKIGTGEGAQAYGHGLYFAENPSVANKYAQQLGDVNSLLTARPQSTLQRDIQSHVKKGMREMEADGALPDMDTVLDWVRGRDDLLPHHNAGYGAIDTAVERLVKHGEKGTLYKADIPEELVSKFLDLDNGGGKIWRDAVLSSGSEEAARKLLLNQGIPGIRYLDDGSRGTGAGTSNYVLFDDQMPRIPEANGKATGLQPWQPGEWEGLLR